jgi:hypothetical protein
MKRCINRDFKGVVTGTICTRMYGPRIKPFRVFCGPDRAWKYLPRNPLPCPAWAKQSRNEMDLESIDQAVTQPNPGKTPHPNFGDFSR